MRDSPPSSRPRSAALMVGVCALVAICAVSVGCKPPPPKRVARPAATAQTPAQQAALLNYLHPQQIGAPMPKMPWIAHVLSVDLDRDGLLDVLACEAQENKVLWIRQTSRGTFEEQAIPGDVKAPVHVEAEDMDGDGDLDLLVACMGVVFPNNDQIGTVTILENRGAGGWTQHDVLERTSRVTDVRAGDLNGDGKLDLAVGQFGYDQGEIRWLERTGPWEFTPHVLLELSGDITVCVADFNGDRLPDIIAQISQQWEEIYLFENRGLGVFERKRIWSSSNEDYGCSGMVVCDLNRDGRPDVLFANGDGFGPAVVPGPRPYHGLQWLENRGQGFFSYRRIGDMPGAYNPVAVDLDQDGHLDAVAVSAFLEKDNQGRPVPTLVWFRNDGLFRFEKRVLAYRPQHQVTLAAGDFDGTGQPCLVAGGFYVFSPSEHMGRVTLWKR